MQMSFRKEGILIHQQRYAEDTVQQFLGDISRSAKTPIEKGADLTPKTESEGSLNVQFTRL